MDSWELTVQRVLARRHLHRKAHVFSRINKSSDSESSSSDCIKEAWSSFYLIIFAFWMISLIWSFQPWRSQTLQRIMSLPELNFTFDRSHSMILCPRSFQWLEWLKSTIHEENITSRQDDLALVIELSPPSPDNRPSSAIPSFHREPSLPFTGRREKGIDRACRRFPWCARCQWRYFSRRNRSIEPLPWPISWFHQCAASAALCRDRRPDRRSRG